jgi:hypothetical protein
MFLAILAAAAVTASAPAPTPTPSITAQTEITVTLPIGVLEAAKQALHKAYTGAEADPVIDAIGKQEQDAVAKLQAAAAKADKKP